MNQKVSIIFQQYQNARGLFAQSVAEIAGKTECVEPLMQNNALLLLRNLLTDISPSIQQNAAIAIGKLANHDPKIAEQLVKMDIIRILLYFNMEKTNKFLKKSALMAIKSIVRHSGELARNVIDIGGLDQVVKSLEDLDPGLKESAAWVLGYIARHDANLALSVIRAGAVPLLVLNLQEPEVSVRQVAASALSDIAKHGPETAEVVIQAGAVPHLVRSVANLDPKLKRQAMTALASIAKHTLEMAELVVAAEIFPIALEHAGHPDEGVRRAACNLIKEIVKHTLELAQLVVEAGGLAVLVNATIQNTGDTKLGGIIALGFIAGHNPALALSVIYAKGVDALAICADDPDPNVAASAFWALGHIGRHSTEHAKNVAACGLLPKILQIYMKPSISEETRVKAKQALKNILIRTEDLAMVEPLLKEAPPMILKYVVAQYSKVLPVNPAARRSFVTSGGLRKLQELVTNGDAPEGSVLWDHITLINQCFPDDVVKYFTPDYPQTLLERVEQFQPVVSMAIDPSMWTDRLFSDTLIPQEVKDEIQELKKALVQGNADAESVKGEDRGNSKQKVPLPSGYREKGKPKANIRKK